jgi:O-antigen ligase
MIAVKFIALFVVGTMPLLFAAVQPWVWSVYSVLIFATFLHLLWQEKIQRLWMPNNIVIIAVVAFFIVTLLQYLPLPSSILSLLSPFRHEALAKSHNLLNDSTSMLSLSYSPGNSFSWWTFLLSAFLFFFLLRNISKSRKSIKLLVGIMVGLAIVEAIYGLIQALVPSLGVLWVDYIQAGLGNSRGTFINRNHFAGFIEMVWPLALGLSLAMGFRGKEVNLKKLLASDRLNKQILLVLGMVIMLLALLLSKSRAGIMGAIIGFFTFILLSRSSEKQLSRGFWVMSGVVIGLIILYGIKIGFDPIIERFLRVGEQFGEGDNRLDIWRDSLVIVKDHPLGIGLGNFKNVYPVYNVSRISDTRFLYAHNDYLHLLVEAGIPGFLALVSGFFIFLVKSIKKVKQMKPHHDPLRFFLAVGALSGLVSLAFHSFFDFNLHMPANLIYFVTLIAIVYNCVWEKRVINSHRPTQTHTNFAAADLTAAKMSSFREINNIRER